MIFSFCLRYKQLLVIAACVFMLMSQVLATPVKTKKELDIKADRIDYDDGRKEVRLVGNVKFTSGDLVMTAPYARYKTDSMIAEFSGGVKIAQPGMSAFGNTMKVLYKESSASLSGNVRLISDKAPAGNDRTPVTLLADSLHYNWQSGMGEAKGSVKVRQGVRRAYAEDAIYDRNADTIVMKNGVRFEQGNDDWLESDLVTVNLATETISAQGQVMGRFIIESAEETSPAQKADLPRAAPIEPVMKPKYEENIEPIILPGLADE